MAFDQSTRNRLQRFVNDARKVQEEEFTRQLQNDYGLDPSSGTITPLENLRHLNDAQRETARILRDTLAHYCASQEADAQTGLERIVREQAFTVLNRLAALRMAEARGLLIESVGNGYQAKGFQLYARLAGTGLGETGDAYRVYLFSVFDELAQDLPGLFDRYSPQGRLFPREASLLQLLALINDAEIEPLWAEDETIGWIYQYFNSKEERKAMRDASQAPRNSRELAVRNQFFTPRYVVEFLVDNTLGRLWFNATGGKSALAGRCQYLLVKPDEQPVASSRLRDPRTLKLLDPACGSMHFGLYAFDLFLEIYREAWDWEQEHGPGSLDISTQPSAHLKPLNQTYADQASFLRDVPRLIIEHNIYGVDIDPRAAQIASLALWLRAQRAWHAEDVKANDRPLIGRGHVMAAIAPPAERELRLQFTAELDQLDAVLFEKTLQLLKGLPEMGVLLQVEREIPNLIRQIYVGGKGNDLLSKQEQETWQKAEARLRDALIGFTQAAKATYQGRLFAQDALEGLRLIDLTREKFDVVVMNPPFGLPSAASKGYLVDAYPDTWKDIYAAFIERSLDLLRNAGFLGAITPSMWQYTREMRALRKMLFDVGSPTLLVELGGGVMDDAAVEAAVWTATKSNSVDELWSMDLLYERKEERATLMLSKGELWRQNKVEEFSRVADSPYCHHLPRNLLNLWKHPGRLSQVARIAAGNTTFDDFRFLRFWVETASEDQEKWRTYRSGGDFQPFYAATKLRILWERDGASVRASGIAKHGSDAQVMQSSELWNQGGLGYPRIGTLGLGIRVAPTGEIFSSGSVFILPEDSDQRLVLLGLLNSSLALALFEAHGRHRKTETIALKDLPVLPGHLQSIQNSIESDVLKAVDAIQSLESMDETNLLFVRPWPSSRFGSLSEYSETVYKRVLSSATSISNAIATHLGVDATNLPAPDAINWNPRVAIEEEAARVFSYLVGVTFGRWDIRKGISGDGTRPSTDPFASLPASPLGGMQKSSAYLSSKVQSAEKIQVTYPIEVVKKGVIDDDASAISSLVAKIAESMCVVWGQGAEEIEQAICAALGVTDFGQYLRKPSCFFSDHIRRYSSNRRQAPIYWPLTTTSGNYTLWLYYPSLSSQTLYTAVNDFVEPKLKHVGDDVAALRNRGAARSRDDEKQFETLQAFELELIELRDKLLKIAQDYQPNHDDGVQITAAPLWPLFRHKPWQKVLKDTWAKLEKGDYDWAHLAMSYWPARVREKCKNDKSLAIAHDLEALYVEPEAKPKKTRAAKGTEK